jgi:hypothetical protein
MSISYVSLLQYLRLTYTNRWLSSLPSAVEAVGELNHASDFIAAVRPDPVTWFMT